MATAIRPRPQLGAFKYSADERSRLCPFCRVGNIGALNHRTCDPCARAGVRVSPDGAPLGLSPRTLRDMASAAKRARLRLAVDAA